MWEDVFSRSSGRAVDRQSKGCRFEFCGKTTFFALLVLSSRRSGGSSLSFLAGSFRLEARKTIKD